MIKLRNLTIKQKQILIGYLFVLPCMIILLLMMAKPVFQTLLYSFSTVELPYFETKFVGFSNFIRMLSKPEMAGIIKITLLWTFFVVLLRIIFGMGTALVMNANIAGIFFFRILALLPWTIPSIVSSNLWRWIFQSDFGLLNGTLRHIGLSNLAYSWLGSSNTALGSVIFASTWAGYPFVMMMLLSGMQSMPKELFESAEIDGANKMQLFWNITLPCLKPVLFVVITLEIIGALNSFDMLYTMTGGGPGGTSEVLSLFIYRTGFSNYDFGGASAVSILLICFIVICFLLYAPTQMKKK